MRRAAAMLCLALLAGCGRDGETAGQDIAATLPVTVTTADGRAHRFAAEQADTVEEQARGLKFRTNLAADDAMLFWPYPPEGPPRVASFWMADTPHALDILFIRADGTVATLAEDTVPYSRAPIPSGEPVAAVLEIPAGRAAALGIAEEDRVSWPGGPKAP